MYIMDHPFNIRWCMFFIHNLFLRHKVLSENFFVPHIRARDIEFFPPSNLIDSIYFLQISVAHPSFFKFNGWFLRNNILQISTRKFEILIFTGKSLYFYNRDFVIK